jgi:chromosome segregation ATPase
MMLRRKAPLALLATLLVYCLAGCSDSSPDADGAGQDSSSPPAAPGGGSATDDSSPFDDPQMTLIAEYQQIQRRLGEIQRHAMQDSTLMASYQALEKQIEAEMHNIDPELGTKRDRLTSLQEDMSQAQQSGDQDAMQRINQEGSALQAELEQLETDVVDGESLSEEVQAFRDEIEAKMREIDPETDQLISRAREIVDIVQQQQEAAAAQDSTGQSEGAGQP